MIPDVIGKTPNAVKTLLSQAVRANVVPITLSGK
jgi:hypothetical protein